jgi:hypothetical protein
MCGWERGEFVRLGEVACVQVEEGECGWGGLQRGECAEKGKENARGWGRVGVCGLGEGECVLVEKG